MNIFEFHSNNMMEDIGAQFRGTCPFCDKDKHFYSSKDWQYDCKSCMKRGNQYTFIREIHKMFFKGDAPELAKLAELKGLSIRSLRECGVAFNPWNYSYIIPASKNGDIINLYKYVVTSNTIMASPGIPQAVMNWPETTEDTIWLLEGHWDRIASQTILGTSRPITPIAVPGAGVFHPSWVQLFRDKHLVLCFDNDKAGQTGMQAIVEKHLAASPQKPKSVSYINWKNVPEGYDLRDCLLEHERRAFDIIDSMIEPYPIPSGVHCVNTAVEDIIEDKSIDTFEKFMEVFRKAYYTTKDMELALLLILSSIYSVSVKGEQIWIRLIGPPGCGKTSIAKAVSASAQVVLRSTFTGLFSGWKDDNDDDPSLIPIIAGKTLIVKDADALLRQPNIERIMSELRDFYDKDSSMSYKNRVSREYHNIRSTMVLCGTNSLRRSDNSFLGERFLDFEMRILDVDKDAIYEKVMEKSLTDEEDQREQLVMSAAKGFINHLMQREHKASVPVELRTHITKLASLVADLRTVVERDRAGEITFDPHPELATRLIGQFVKVARCAPAVLDEPVAGDTVKQLLHKLTMDILDPASNRFKIVESLAIAPGQTRDELVRRLGLKSTTCSKELDDLRRLNFITPSVRKTESGNKAYGWSLNESLRSTFLLLLEDIPE